MSLFEVAILLCQAGNLLFMHYTIKQQNLHWEYMKSLDRKTDLLAQFVRKLTLESEKA
jgi:hypothetical protein